MSHLKPAALGLGLIVVGVYSCAPDGEKDPSAMPLPGRLVGLKYLGSHQLEYPSDAPSAKSRQILSDGRVVIQHPKTGDLFVFSDKGSLQERIPAPEGVYPGNTPGPYRAIVDDGAKGFLVRFSDILALHKEGLVSFIHFSPGSSRGINIGYEKPVKKPGGEGWWAVSAESSVHILDKAFVTQGPGLYRTARWPGQRTRIEDLDVSDSGSLAVLQEVSWSSWGRGAPESDYTVLYILSSTGELELETDLPSSIKWARDVEFDGRNALVYAEALWVIDTDSRTHLRLKLPGTDPQANAYSLAFVRNGTEVWASSNVRGDETILRFRPEYATVDDGDFGTIMSKRNRSDLAEYRRRTDYRSRGPSGPR